MKATRLKPGMIIRMKTSTAAWEVLRRERTDSIHNVPARCISTGDAPASWVNKYNIAVRWNAGERQVFSQYLTEDEDFFVEYDEFAEWVKKARKRVGAR